MSTTHARKMAELKREFLLRTRDDISELKRAREDAVWRASRELKTLVHRLAGVTGMFGYESVSELAGALEDALGSGDHSRADAKLQALIAAVEAMVGEAR
jgi:HPt (histidine-containing phosphotransfer) domain-containing protein